MSEPKKNYGFDPGEDFRNRLIEVFGKTSFAEEDLTQEFYATLYNSFSDFFETDAGINLNQFWSPQLKEWLLHGDDCVELQLLGLLEMLPPDFNLIRDYLKNTELSPGKITSTAIRFINENCQFEADEEKSADELHSTYLFALLEILLEHGLDPNGIFDSENIMDSLDLVDTGYVAADTMGLLLLHGGDLYLECNGEILFDRIEFNVIFDAINQENRDRYDQLVHLWLVMIGYGAQSMSAEGDRRTMVSLFNPPRYEDQREPFTVEAFKNHRDFSWALTHVPGNGENWSLHIIDKTTGWEVLRL